MEMEGAPKSSLHFHLFVRAKPCLPLCSFSLIRKTELWETNKPPAMRVVVVILLFGAFMGTWMKDKTFAFLDGKFAKNETHDFI